MPTDNKNHQIHDLNHFDHVSVLHLIDDYDEDAPKTRKEDTMVLHHSTFSEVHQVSIRPSCAGGPPVVRTTTNQSGDDTNERPSIDM